MEIEIISKLSKEIEGLKSKVKELTEELDDRYQHCSKLMKERDDLAFRVRKMKAFLDLKD